RALTITGAPVLSGNGPLLPLLQINESTADGRRPVVGRVPGAGEPGADALGGVVDGVVGQQVGIGPHEFAALVGFGVVGLPLPVPGGEEHADAGQVGALAVVEDRGQGEVVGVDGDPDFFSGLAGRAVVERFALLQVAGGQVQHAVAVSGVLPLQQQDLPVPVQDDVDVDNAAVALRHGWPRLGWLTRDVGATIAPGWL